MMTVNVGQLLKGSAKKTIEPAVPSNVGKLLRKKHFSDAIGDIVKNDPTSGLHTYQAGNDTLPLRYYVDNRSLYDNYAPIASPRVWWAPYNWPTVGSLHRVQKVARLLLVFPYTYSNPLSTPQHLVSYEKSVIPLLQEALANRYEMEVKFCPHVLHSPYVWQTGYYHTAFTNWLVPLGALDSLLPSGGDDGHTEDGDRNLITTNCFTVVVCMRQAGAAYTVQQSRAFANSAGYGSDGVSGSFEDNKRKVANLFEQFPKAGNTRKFAVSAFIETKFHDPWRPMFIDMFVHEELVDDSPWIQKQVDSFMGTCAGMKDFNFSFAGLIGDDPIPQPEIYAEKILAKITEYFG